MQLKKHRFDLFLLLMFGLFSWWLFDKSFGYDSVTNAFIIARHQVGDFALHLSLIRSFSWGNNFPPELPYFAGEPLPYHYLFDLLVGLLERVGVRIDMAFNGLSILFFSALLFLIYKLPQIIFAKSRLLGLLSVVLFLGNSSLAFISYFVQNGLSLSKLWFLPDYLHIGPFDGSLISTFFTLNVYLNQRHLVAGLFMVLFVIYLLLVSHSRNVNLAHSWNGFRFMLLLGVLLGVSSLIHTLVMVSASIFIFGFLVLEKRFREMLILLTPVVLILGIRIIPVLGQNLGHAWINPGFHAEKPLTLFNFAKYWFVNLGVGTLTIPLGFYLANRKQKLLFVGIVLLFIIGNTFQLGFRIDHNHSIFNFVFIFANMFSAYFVYRVWQGGITRKFVSVVIVFLLTISGLINLMAVKNDFHLEIADAPKDMLIAWVRDNTAPDS